MAVLTIDVFDSAIEPADAAHLTTHTCDTFRQRGSSGGCGATCPRLLHPLRRHFRLLIAARGPLPEARVAGNVVA